MLKILLFLLLVAVAVYLVVRFVESRGGGARTTGRAPIRPRREPPRIIAPDDDPDFLRELERRRRHRDEPESPA